MAAWKISGSPLDELPNQLTASPSLFNCVSTKLAFATKIEDSVIPELHFDIFANAAGTCCDGPSLRCRKTRATRRADGPCRFAMRQRKSGPGLTLFGREAGP
jgi:hypothetical protein